MIFVTLGSQKFPFDRLLKAVDKLVENGTIKEEVFAQTGYSNYVPHNYRFQKFLNRDEFEKRMEKSEIVISHGGTGVIIGALKKGKKVIAIPRRKKYGEHVDDHQLQLTEQFKELNLISVCLECDELETTLLSIRETKFQEYVSNTAAIINSLIEYIEN